LLIVHLYTAAAAAAALLVAAVQRLRRGVPFSVRLPAATAGVVVVVSRKPLTAVVRVKPL